MLWLVALLRLGHSRARYHAARTLPRLYALLDRTLFTWLIAYVKHPLHICALLVLWGVMLLGGSHPALELVLGNYTNGISAIAASILLARQAQHHAQHSRSLDALHAKVDALAPAQSTTTTTTKEPAP